MNKNKTKVEPEKSCETCLWDNVPRNEHCLACLDKDELIEWQQKYNQPTARDS